MILVVFLKLLKRYSDKNVAETISATKVVWNWNTIILQVSESQGLAIG